MIDLATIAHFALYILLSKTYLIQFSQAATSEGHLATCGIP